ncbi:hypothetical protein DPMN_142303 [Dreissena polymorpha]|uniref:Uncharacterized protein n=1 Tax=Dreissena polymorpha TaxID=45954 RepID=A0A9D4GBE5_DREPO|nr:hypothetical protein DPMN_142303 [Dreissena polymorpha]
MHNLVIADDFQNVSPRTAFDTTAQKTSMQYRMANITPLDLAISEKMIFKTIILY